MPETGLLRSNGEIQRGGRVTTEPALETPQRNPCSIGATCFQQLSQMLIIQAESQLSAESQCPLHSNTLDSRHRHNLDTVPAHAFQVPV